MSTKFGVELETICANSHDEMARIFQTAGLRVQTGSTGSYHSHSYTGWQMKYDGSISTSRGPGPRRRRAASAEDNSETRTLPIAAYYTGVEIVSPVLNWNQTGKEELIKAIDTAAPHCTVNTSCGFHVHVSAEGLTAPKLERLKALWTNLEPIVFSYLPPSRRRNHFCRRGYSPNTSERYYSLNLACLPVKGTVEFRCHQGTVNKKKVLSWVAFCVALVEYAKSDRPLPTISMNPTATADGRQIIEVTFRKRVFQIETFENGFTYNGRVFTDLKAAVLAVVKTLNPNRTRDLTDRFINRNVKRTDGTAAIVATESPMKVVCDAINVEEDAAAALIERYAYAVQVWGTDEAARR